MENLRKSKRGITLVALVVTIVVLIILAIISINLLLNGGLINRSQKGKLLMQLSSIEEKANLIYADKVTNQYLTDINKGKEPTLSEVIDELKKMQDGTWKIESEETKENVVTALNIDKAKMKLAVGSNKEIIATIEIEENETNPATYYVVIESKSYKIEKVNGTIRIAREETIRNAEAVLTETTITAESSDKTKATTTVTKESNTRYKITVTGLSTGTVNITVGYIGYAEKKTCAVTVVTSMEGIPPTATIGLCTDRTMSGEPVKATVTQKDNDGGSGLNISDCRWIYTTKETIDKNDTIWNTSDAKKFTNATEVLNLSATEGKYYLQVLTVDKDENRTVTRSEKITVIDVVTDWEQAGKVNVVTSRDGIKVPVPKGFTVSSVPSENTVENGLVIYQNVAGKADGDGANTVTESNNNEAMTTRNQFVWIPVHCTREMFEIKENRNVGILYNSSIYENTNGNAEVERWDFKYDGNYEPVTSYQTDFNQMKASVEKYKGFYIARYETGNLEHTQALSVKGNNELGDHNWSQLFNKNKTIVNSNGITSHMIWGCQWDAIWRWILSQGGTKASYITNSRAIGNYSGEVKPSGYRSLNNIYDMAGNVCEWTMEYDGWYVSRRWSC